MHAGGLCCIDEFDGIKEADKVSIHEVMEQQTLSIAKAGLVTSLSTRTSVFGAMNPRGNAKNSLAEQTSLSGPLLSRFDILLPVFDSKSSEADDIISEHILVNHQLHRSAKVQVRNRFPKLLLPWKACISDLLSMQACSLAQYCCIFPSPSSARM